MTNKIARYAAIGASALALTLGGCATTQSSQSSGLERDVQHSPSTSQSAKEDHSFRDTLLYNVAIGVPQLVFMIL